MLTEERFAKILSILESMGSVTVQQLMTELNASESTIRRDLNALDALHFSGFGYWCCFLENAFLILLLICAGRWTT